MSRNVDGVHWPDLDGLRAFAILLVVARHSLRPFISEDDYQAVLTIGSIDLTPVLLNGWIGVDLFFVLSGFLIGRQAWRSESVRRFWFKRVTRILPAYLVCLAAVAVALTLGRAWAGKADDMLAHVLMLQDYTGSVFVPAFWSLGVEEKFYLLAPVLVVLLSLVRGGWWQGVALVGLWLLPVMSRAVLAGAGPETIGYTEYFYRYRSPFHMTCESLVVGLAIAWMSLQLREVRVPRVIREACFWAGALGAAYWLTPSLILERIDARTIVLAPAIIGLCFGSIVLACVSGPGTYSACLGWATWRPIATGSYTLYLTHMMVMPIAGALAVMYPLVPGQSMVARWLAFLPWYLTLAVASAYVLHRYVERPVLVWRDRYLRRNRDSSGRFAAPAATTERQPATA
jgi:peptidoglycan/LPS O-acetylase OafA/YrhL